MSRDDYYLPGRVLYDLSKYFADRWFLLLPFQRWAAHKGCELTSDLVKHVPLLNASCEGIKDSYCEDNSDSCSDHGLKNITTINTKKGVEERER